MQTVRPNTRRPLRKSAVAALIVGILLAAGAGLWWGVAAPALVTFPLDTNVSLHYGGRFVTFVDPSSGATLARPTSASLVVDRHIRAVPSESSGSVAVVHEDITLRYAGQVAQEHNVFAIDRSTMQNVASSAAFTFAPGNRAATPGSYYVTLPMNLQPGDTPVRMWKPESGTTYPLKALPTEHRYSTLDGLRVAWFSGVLPMTPVAPYERKALAARGLPMTIAPAQVEAELASRGVSVSALATTLAPVLSPAETAKVAAVLTHPVALRYSAYGTGLLATETRTGAIIKLQDIVDGIAVAPDPTGIRTLVGVLQAHEAVPGVPAAISALEALASAPPQKVYELHYTQTPASVAAMVVTTQSKLDQIRIVEDVIPIAAGAVGLVLIVVGLVFLRRRPPTGTAAAGTLPEQAALPVEGPTGQVPTEATIPAAEQPGRRRGAA